MATPPAAPLDDVAERYRRRADAFERTVANVQPERWGDPSPYDEWDARGVLQHCLDMHAVVLRPTGLSLPAEPTAETDPKGI